MSFWERFRRKIFFLTDVRKEPQIAGMRDAGQGALTDYASHDTSSRQEPVFPISVEGERPTSLGHSIQSSSKSLPVAKFPTLESENTSIQVASLAKSKGVGSNVVEISIAQIQMHTALKEWDKGLTLGQRILGAHSNDPNIVEIYKLVGDIWRHMSQFDQAIDNYQEALVLRPDDYELCDCLGTLYGTLGHWQKAMSYYEEAVTLNPNFTEAYHRLSYAWNQLEQLEPTTDKNKEDLIVGPELFTFDSNTSTSRDIDVSWAEERLSTR